MVKMVQIHILRQFNGNLVQMVLRCLLFVKVVYTKEASRWAEASGNCNFFTKYDQFKFYSNKKCKVNVIQGCLKKH